MKSKLTKFAKVAGISLALAKTTFVTLAFFAATACGGGSGDVSVVKKGTLQMCPAFTMEEMFEALLEKPKWQSVTENGIGYVNISGITAGGGKPQNVLAKFWVRNNEFGGQAFQIDGLVANAQNIISTACLRAADKAAEKARVISADPIKDTRDGKTYKTVKIGEQVWMAENLNYAADGAKCYGEKGDCTLDIFGNKKCTPKYTSAEIQANCQKYGRLYNLETAMKACPNGWHLPNKDEWQKLIGGRRLMIAKYLKAKSGWDRNDGTDNYGFSALPGGWSNGDYNDVDVGYIGLWWTATKYGDDGAYNLIIGSNVDFSGNRNKDLFSIRCVQD